VAKTELTSFGHTDSKCKDELVCGYVVMIKINHHLQKSVGFMKPFDPTVLNEVELKEEICSKLKCLLPF